MPLDPCKDAGANCGIIPDGKGGQVNCGLCPAGSTCGAGGPNKCGATSNVSTDISQPSPGFQLGGGYTKQATGLQALIEADKNRRTGSGPAPSGSAKLELTYASCKDRIDYMPTPGMDPDTSSAYNQDLACQFLTTSDSIPALKLAKAAYTTKGWPKAAAMAQERIDYLTALATPPPKDEPPPPKTEDKIPPAIDDTVPPKDDTTKTTPPTLDVPPATGMSGGWMAVLALAGATVVGLGIWGTVTALKTKPREHNPVKRGKKAVPTEVPKSQIEWLVGRLNVGETDKTVREDIEARARKAGASDSLVKSCGDYAVKVHHKNIDLYNQVMSGRFR